MKKTGLVKQLYNEEDPTAHSKLKKLGTTCTMRYEMIEQTNTIIRTQFHVRGLQENYLLYKISRIRETNDYVVFYTSKRAKNDYVKGSKWEPAEIPIKELCRNDPDRPLRFEVYEWRRVKGVVY